MKRCEASVLINSAEKGILVTVIGDINAVGNAIPPYFIFPTVHFKSFMVDDISPGSAGNVQPNGCVGCMKMFFWIT